MSDKPSDTDYTDDDLNETSIGDVDSEALSQITEEAADKPDVDASSDLDEGTPDQPDDFDTLWSEFEGGNPHVTVDKPPYKRQPLNQATLGLSALKTGPDETEALVERYGLDNLDEDKVAKLKNSEKRFVNLIRNLSTLWQEGYFDGVDHEGDWHQSILHKEANLGPGKLRPENMKDPIQAIRASFGQGCVVQIPIWYTGLWLSFRPPTLEELLNLEQRIRLEKINLGRSSNGMVFSNSEVYTVETYMEFAMSLVVAANYEFTTSDRVGELMQIVKSPDYHAVIWGVLLAMHPDGYPFRQPCVAEIDSCNHVDEMVLNFSRMGFVDRDKVSENQALKMASRKTKRDIKWLEDYQAEFAFHEHRVQIRKDMTMVLHSPSLADQITAGHLWVEGISASTEKAFGERLSQHDRIRHIMRSGVLTNLRQYGHWIKHFEYTADSDDAPRIIDLPEEKDRLLNMFSESAEHSDVIKRGIEDYFKKIAIFFVGIPKIKCPSCQQPAADETHPYLIPLDVGFIFFTLAAYKISQVENVAQ